MKIGKHTKQTNLAPLEHQLKFNFRLTIVMPVQVTERRKQVSLTQIIYAGLLLEAQIVSYEPVAGLEREVLKSGCG